MFQIVDTTITINPDDPTAAILSLSLETDEMSLSEAQELQAAVLSLTDKDVTLNDD